MVVDEKLEPLESWTNASDEARAEFQSIMLDKHYGTEECRDAWLWFYEGWCRAQDYMSVGWEHMARAGDAR